MTRLNPDPAAGQLARSTSAQVPRDATICRFCGDGDVRSARNASGNLHVWTMVIPHPVTSLNKRRTNSGATMHAYKVERDTWGWAVKAERLRLKITNATGPRRLEITRMVVHPSKLMDAINFAGGVKPLVDALRLEKLIVDDSPEFVVDHYHQRTSILPSDHNLVVITLTDLLPEAA